MKPARKRKVLLVEDELDVRETLAELLVLRGYDVVTAENGEEALGKLVLAEIVVTDLRMPRMDGAELLRKAAKQRPELPFVLISGHLVDLGELGHGASVHPPVLVHKPFNIDTLVKAIEQQCAAVKKA